MSASFKVKPLRRRQRHENSLQIVIEPSPVLALGLALIATFERCGTDKRPPPYFRSDSSTRNTFHAN